MKAKSFALLLGISNSFFVPILVAQDQNQPLRGYFKSFPLQGNTVEGAMNESASGTTVPLFSVVTTASRDKNKYTTTLMGGYWNISNLSGNQTTDIQTVVIPLVVTMPDGVVFDPQQRHMIQTAILSAYRSLLRKIPHCFRMLRSLGAALMWARLSMLMPKCEPSFGMA